MKAVAELLLSREAVVLRPSDPFRFASGILSPIYCDNRLLLSDVEGRRLVIDGLASTVSSDVKQIAGVATAGIAWGGWVAEKLSLPFVYLRSSAKGHGKKNLVEGKLEKVQTALIEDLVSTGGSVLRAAKELSESGVPLKGVYGIFSYGFSEAKEAFSTQNLPLETLVMLDELLDVAQEMGKVSAEEAKSVLAWRSDPRAWDEKRSK